VVLRTHKLGEADRILVVLTNEHGKIRAVAKGVRKPTSKFGGRLEPLAHVKLLVRVGRSLDVVAQAETIDHFRPLRTDLSLLTHAMAMVEAVDQLAPEREPAPQLYRMLLGGLRTLAAGHAPLVVPAFYWKLLAADGVAPELEACVSCGAPGPLVAFSVEEGGVLCRTCRRGAAVSEAAVALLRRILGGDLVAALREPASAATHEVEVLAVRSLEHHLERRLRSVALLEPH
jgi:DNA repair protein RecO (recombination protein O)